MVVASVPLTWNHPFARLVTGSWVCASHWPGGTPQEPDDHAEGDEGQRGKRQYGERPWNRDPTLHCPSEESEPHDQEVANTSDKLAESVDFQASSGNVRLSCASLLPQGLWKQSCYPPPSIVVLPPSSRLALLQSRETPAPERNGFQVGPPAARRAVRGPTSLEIVKGSNDSSRALTLTNSGTGAPTYRRPETVRRASLMPHNCSPAT